MDEAMLQAFLAESRENLARLEAQLASLEQGAGAPGRLEDVTATLRAIAGTCAFLGLPEAGTLARSVEAALHQLRSLSDPAGCSPTAAREAVAAIRRSLAERDTAGPVALTPPETSAASAAASARTDDGSPTGLPHTEPVSGTDGLLLFDAGETLMAVPLSVVDRLDDVAPAEIERRGNQLAVSRGGETLPLLLAAGAARWRDIGEARPVIVLCREGRRVGLIVDRVRGPVEGRPTLRVRSQRPGVLGTAIVTGRATDLLDADDYLRRAHPGAFRRRPHRRILVVDDSLFFRRLATAALDAEGCQVVACATGEQAVERIAAGERFDAVVCDADLAHWEDDRLPRWLRSCPERRGMPLIALATAVSPDRQTRAVQAGFDRLLKKFHAPELVRTIDELCQAPSAACGATGFRTG